MRRSVAVAGWKNSRAECVGCAAFSLVALKVARQCKGAKKCAGGVGCWRRVKVAHEQAQRVGRVEPAPRAAPQEAAHLCWLGTSTSEAAEGIMRSGGGAVSQAVCGGSSEKKPAWKRSVRAAREKGGSQKGAHAAVLLAVRYTHLWRVEPCHLHSEMVHASSHAGACGPPSLPFPASSGWCWVPPSTTTMRMCLQSTQNSENGGVGKTWRLTMCVCLNSAAAGTCRESVRDN